MEIDAERKSITMTRAEIEKAVLGRQAELRKKDAEEGKEIEDRTDSD